jgi:polyhydroxyalkanoate synthesis regulator phasin
MDKKLEQLFFAVLGGALAVKEKIEASNEDLKVWQEKSEKNARTFFDELAQRGEKEKNQLKQMLKEILKEAVVELDLATKQDLEKLKKELDK